MTSQLTESCMLNFLFNLRFSKLLSVLYHKDSSRYSTFPGFQLPFPSDPSSGEPEVPGQPSDRRRRTRRESTTGRRVVDAPRPDAHQRPERGRRRR